MEKKERKKLENFISKRIAKKSLRSVTGGDGTINNGNQPRPT